MGLKDYFKPTPKLFKRIGNALVATSLFLGGYALIKEETVLMYWVVALGGIGKFTTEFFSSK